MKQFTAGFFIGILFICILFLGNQFLLSFHIQSPLPLIQTTPTPKPLEKYMFEELKKRSYEVSDIVIDSKVNETPNFISYLYHFLSDGKKVSGLLTIPNKSGSYPIIVMFRGYVPIEKYQTGMGTVHAGEVFASNGLISIAPDFLGYGESASPSADVFEERFETYTTALHTLASVSKLNNTFKTISTPSITALSDKVGIWGHSNGGHIALTILELVSKTYPTVLWAPVSKPFPYSILYYTDDIDDHGKALRGVVANFEKNYDSEHYSLTNYLNWIDSPIQLHQGVEDEAVPLTWSNLLFATLKKMNKDITYFTYPGDDHNFSKGSWNTVVARNILFYKEKLSL